MTGTNCDLFTHKLSQSYLNHLVFSETDSGVCVCIYIHKNDPYKHHSLWKSIYIQMWDTENISTGHLPKKCMRLPCFNIFNLALFIYFFFFKYFFSNLIQTEFCSVCFIPKAICVCLFTFYIIVYMQGFEIPIPYSSEYFPSFLVTSLIMGFLAETCSWFVRQINCCV